MAIGKRARVQKHIDGVFAQQMEFQQCAAVAGDLPFLVHFAGEISGLHVCERTGICQGLSVPAEQQARRAGSLQLHSEAGGDGGRARQLICVRGGRSGRLRLDRGAQQLPYNSPGLLITGCPRIRTLDLSTQHIRDKCRLGGGYHHNRQIRLEPSQHRHGFTTFVH